MKISKAPLLHSCSNTTSTTQELPQNKVTSVATSCQTWPDQRASHDGAGGPGGRYHSPPPHYTHTSIQLVNPQTHNRHRHFTSHPSHFLRCYSHYRKKNPPRCFQTFMLPTQYFSGMFVGILLSTQDLPTSLPVLRRHVSPLSPPQTAYLRAINPLPSVFGLKPLDPAQTHGAQVLCRASKKNPRPPLKMYTCSFNALIINCYKT